MSWALITGLILFATDPMVAEAVHVFERGKQQWRHVAKLAAADGEPADYFGWAVAVSDNTAVVAAKQEGREHGAVRGAAYVFERTAHGQWRQRQKLTGCVGKRCSRFGESVDISGRVLVVGTQDRIEGVVYVFQRAGSGDWKQAAVLHNGTPNRYGRAVATNGRAIGVGATHANRTYVYGQW